MAFSVESGIKRPGSARIHCFVGTAVQRNKYGGLSIHGQLGFAPAAAELQRGTVQGQGERVAVPGGG